MTQPNFDQAWNLGNHGTTLESRHAARLAKDAPNYELFWRSHVVPLSFRPWHPNAKAIRSELKPALAELANRSYAGVFHLGACLDWASRWDSKDWQKQGVAAAESLYCFFAHAGSFKDATQYFAFSVDRTCNKYGGSAPFRCSAPRTVKDTPRIKEPKQVKSARKRFCNAYEEYRHFQVHVHPNYAADGYLPDSKSLKHRREESDLGDLSAWAKAAAGARRRESLVPVESVLDDCLQKCLELMNLVWGTANQALDGIAANDPSYVRDQRKLNPADQQVGSKALSRVREGS